MVESWLEHLRTRSVRAWLNALDKTRLIGRHYDPENGPAYHMSGGSLADWFDIIIYMVK